MPQATEQAHVARAGFMVDDAGHHEQRSLETRMVQNVEHRRHGRQRRTETDQKSDQPQVADRRVGQQAFKVVLEDGDKSCKRHGHQSGGADQTGKQLGAADNGRQAGQQEDAGLDHRGRVQIG